jgi:two-component system chemotaxis response regulator CheY
MRHCLIVDDSDVVRKVAKKVLEDLHFTSTEEEGAEPALESCRRALPDVVLLDWHMPGMGAHEFMQLLRRIPGGDAPLVIYCTTENDRNDIAAARRSGASEILMKPFDRDDLATALKRAGAMAAA